MKIKVWCRKYFVNSHILEDIPESGVTIYNEKVIDFDLKEFEKYLGCQGYYYTSLLYDYIHEKYKYVDIIGYGNDLEYEIIEKGYLDNIPFLSEPLESIKELEEKMKIKQ